MTTIINTGSNAVNSTKLDLKNRFIFVLPKQDYYLIVDLSLKSVNEYDVISYNEIFQEVDTLKGLNKYLKEIHESVDAYKCINFFWVHDSLIPNINDIKWNILDQDELNNEIIQFMIDHRQCGAFFIEKIIKNYWNYVND